MTKITQDDVGRALRAAIKDAGSQAALASKIGVDPSYVSMMLAGERTISDKVLDYLGFTRRVLLEVKRAPSLRN